MSDIVIAPYQDAWPAEFAAITQHLTSVLTQDAKGIEHIGSTAVPGLAAKDIIDIQIGVTELAPTITAKLQQAGYEYVAKNNLDHLPAGETGPLTAWSKLYFRQRAGQHRCHIHLRIVGNPNHRYALLFRDYLRAHAPARLTVEHIKRELTRLHANDAEAYYAIKDPVYDLIWQAANVWAAGVSWSAETNPSDP